MMRLPPFTFLSPPTVQEALEMKASARGDGMYVAGGTDLYPNMKRRHQTPGTVVNLAGIASLKSISGSPREGLRLGSGLILNRVGAHPLVQRHYPALATAVRSISTPILRNMGTLGGNVLLDTRCNYYNQTYEWRKSINFCMKKDGEICWVAPSSPRCWAVQSSDCVPVLVALGARYRLLGRDGEREIDAEALYRDDGINYLDKRPHELLTEIVLPPADGWKAAFRKLRRRGAFDFPVLNVAVWARVDGVVEDIRIVVGAVGSSPLRARAAEDLLKGQRLTEETIAAAAEAAYGPAKPLDNTDFAYAWRKQMVRKYVRDTLQDIVGQESCQA